MAAMSRYIRGLASGVLAGAIIGGCDALDVDKPTYGLVFGTVTTAAGASIPGVPLTAFGGPVVAGCVFESRILTETTTNAAGAYRLSIAELAPGDSECVFVRVRAPTGLRDTTMGPVRVRLRRPLQDSVALDITLSP